MRKGLRAAAVAFGSASLLLANMAQNPAQAAEVKAFVTGAARPMYDVLAPQFERATGHKLTTVSGLPPELVAKVDAGEPFDIIVLSYDVEALIKRGKVEASSRTVLGQTGIGVGIRSGSPKPDFSTVEKFKEMLLNARFIATSGEGSSGRYVASLLDRLGIADQVKPKLKQTPTGVFVGTITASGEAEIGIQQVSEMAQFPGVDYVGPLPADIQKMTVFTSGVAANAKEPAAGKALLKFITSPDAAATFKKRGMEPG
jgi:molybdate transport system substrate-binding protein